MPSMMRQLQMMEDQIRQMGEMIAHADAAANAKVAAMSGQLDSLRAELLVYKNHAINKPKWDEEAAPTGSGAAYSLRYRNDTASGSLDGIHRLEWIAQTTALDPDTGDPWPDDDWTAVEGGDAVLLE